MLPVVNLKRARDKQHNEVIKEIPKFKVGDLVLKRNHKKHTPWDTKDMSKIHIFKVINQGISPARPLWSCSSCFSSKHTIINAIIICG